MNSNLIKLIKLWFIAVRPFAYPASLIPVLFGISISVYSYGKYNIVNSFLCLIGVVLIHTGTNLYNDVFDYLKGIDTVHSFGSSGILPPKIMSPKQIIIGGTLCFVIASVLGLYLVHIGGVPILILGVVGILGGILYTAGPIGYKYYALGEIMVFFLMGPLIILGTFILQAPEHVLSIKIIVKLFFLSIPIGIFVALILLGNNIRDIQHDLKAGIKTLPIILGKEKAKKLYLLLLIISYSLTLIFILLKYLSFFSLVVFLTIPIATKNYRMLFDIEKIKMVDKAGAMLHLIFGLLLSLSLIF